MNKTNRERKLEALREYWYKLYTGNWANIPVIYDHSSVEYTQLDPSDLKRCWYCGGLNEQAALKCVHCGGPPIGPVGAEDSEDEIAPSVLAYW